MALLVNSSMLRRASEQLALIYLSLKAPASDNRLCTEERKY